MQWGGYSMATDRRKTHGCNCVGCCPTCGQCRTAPWHAKSCAEVARLKAEIARAVESAA